MPATTFLIALGSNRRHGRHGAPAATVTAAVTRIGSTIGSVLAVSPIVRTDAVGPGGRAYANAAALVRTGLDPIALLDAMKATERGFGRRPGRRWGARVLDLDILAWEGGAVARRDLTVPHPRLRERAFALGPAVAIAGRWRLPRTAGTLAHHLARLRRPRPVDRLPPHH